MADETFVASTSDDGLSFSESKGNTYTQPISAEKVRDRDLSALFSQGLFGAPDKKHPESGYFNPNVRATFAMTVDEDVIISQGISAGFLLSIAIPTSHTNFLIIISTL